MLRVPSTASLGRRPSTCCQPSIRRVRRILLEIWRDGDKERGKEREREREREREMEGERLRKEEGEEERSSF